MSRRRSRTIAQKRQELEKHEKAIQTQERHFDQVARGEKAGQDRTVKKTAVQRQKIIRQSAEKAEKLRAELAQLQDQVQVPSGEGRFQPRVQKVLWSRPQTLPTELGGARGCPTSCTRCGASPPRARQPL